MSDIATLFARDPLKLTDEDIDAIILKFREVRHTFQVGGSTPGAAPKKLTEKEQAAKKLDLPSIDL